MAAAALTVKAHEKQRGRFGPGLPHHGFGEAAQLIEEAMDYLKKVAEALPKSANDPRFANDKAEKLKITSFTRGNATMAARFAELPTTQLVLAELHEGPCAAG